MWFEQILSQCQLLFHNDAPIDYEEGARILQYQMPQTNRKCYCRDLATSFCWHNKTIKPVRKLNQYEN